MKKLPILFINFNRPDLTQKIFEKIIEYSPEKLYISCDGPRINKEGEEELVNKTKDILGKIPKEIEVFYKYNNENLGCKLAVSSAITWFFEKEVEGIILEDDTLPSNSFFHYCEELINYYRDNNNIGIISGDNFFKNNFKIKDSYYFSKYTHIWGWATWKRVWDTYRVEISEHDLNNKKWYKKLDKYEKDFWMNVLKEFSKYNIDTWDHQLTFSNFLNQRMNIMPSKNLISNIGFREDATHTKINSELSNLPSNELDFPLSHPDKIKLNKQADSFSKRFFVKSNSESIYFNILLKMKNYIFKLIKHGFLK